MTRFANIFARVNESFKGLLIRGLAMLILGFLFFIAIGGVSQHDRWRIDRVDITGAQTVDQNAIENMVREKLKGNYYLAYARGNSYLFPRREIEDGLLVAFPRLLRVQTHRVDAHTIAISASERKPYALWCGEVYLGTGHPSEECWFIDDTGFVFDRAPTFSEGVYLEIYGGLVGANKEGVLRAHLPQPQFGLLYTLASALSRELGAPLRMVLKPEGEVTVTMKKSDKYPVLAGVEIRFKDSISAEEIMKNLLAALPVQFPAGATPKKKLLYIDMRFGNKIFFGFEN